MNDRSVDYTLDVLAGGRPTIHVGDIVILTADLPGSPALQPPKGLRGKVVAISRYLLILTVDFAMSGWTKGHSGGGIAPSGSRTHWCLHADDVKVVIDDE